LPWAAIDKGSDIQSVGDNGWAYIPRRMAEEKELEYTED